MKLSFPPHGDIQEIIDGKQVSMYPSAAPVTALYTYSGETATVPHSLSAARQKKRVMATVFMGTELLPQQHCTQRQQPQQSSGATAHPLGGGVLTSDTTPHLRIQHLQTSVIPQTQLLGTSQYQYPGKSEDLNCMCGLPFISICSEPTTYRITVHSSKYG